MNQLNYYLIKGMARGTITLDFSSNIRQAYRPYLEYVYTLRQSGVKIGSCGCASSDLPIMDLYGTFLDLRPLIKVKRKLGEIAKKKADKEFMKDLLASLTKTETYRNE